MEAGATPGAPGGPSRVAQASRGQEAGCDRPMGAQCWGSTCTCRISLRWHRPPRCGQHGWLLSLLLVLFR